MRRVASWLGMADVISNGNPGKQRDGDGHVAKRHMEGRLGMKAHTISKHLQVFLSLEIATAITCYCPLATGSLHPRAH